MNVQSDYCGIIAKIDRTMAIEGADNIQVAYVLGEAVIVSKSLTEGFEGVFFPPDTKLSVEYLKNNNLYRDSNRNLDKEKTGFFDVNGRVRAQPFLGVKSCGYFAEIGSLGFTGYDLDALTVGDRFEELNGVGIAEKYVNPKTLMAKGNANTKARKAVETPLFHQHKDTDQYKYHAASIPAGAIVSIQAKGHGTSARYSNTLVVKEPDYSGFKGKMKYLVDLVFGSVGIPKLSWEYVAGTRRVVLKQQDADKEGFHGSEAFRFEILEQLKPHLDRGVTVYGEIVGFANGKPIMGTHDVTKLKDKKYTKKYGKTITYKYGCPQDTYRFYVYRVTITSIDGLEIDLMPAQLKEWCLNRNIEPALDLVEPFAYDGDVSKLNEMVERLTEREELLCEDYRDPSHISEGVVIRVDYNGLVPKFYKSKSTPFRILEGIYKETNVDLEDAS